MTDDASLKHSHVPGGAWLCFFVSHFYWTKNAGTCIFVQ